MKIIEYTNKEALTLSLDSDNTTMGKIVKSVPGDMLTLYITTKYEMPASEAKKLLKELLDEHSDY